MTTDQALAAVGLAFSVVGIVVAVTRGFTVVASRLDAIVYELRDFKGTVTDTLERHSVKLDAHDRALTELHVRGENTERRLESQESR